MRIPNLLLHSLWFSFALISSCASERLERDRVSAAPAPRPWADAVRREVDSMGYGNWIVVAEASFPVHSRRGVRTLVVDGEIPDILDEVVTSLDYSDSVKPFFTTAKELPFVSNDRAPGMDLFRAQLKEALHGHGTREMDYRSLGLLLESESKKFAVLVLKSKTALPYSSVFIELHSNYWDLENERAMRDRMEKRQPKTTS
ncbi:MAG: hypothetical protein ACQKBY_11105 [Verrucomicrobiales bacterium]